MRYIKKILSLLLISFFILPVIGIDNINSMIYTTLVDQRHGFYKVFEGDNETPIPYDNRTLHISVGDTVFWKNDAYPETTLTIMNKQNLWNDSGVLPINYKKFGYTFNKSGIYNIYIKEFPIFNQTIIVGNINEKMVNSSKNYKQDNKQIPNINTTYIGETKKIVVYEANSSNSTVSNSTISNLSTRISSNFILIIILLSMLILMRGIENKYCDKKRKV